MDSDVNWWKFSLGIFIGLLTLAIHTAALFRWGGIFDKLESVMVALIPLIEMIAVFVGGLYGLIFSWVYVYDWVAKATSWHIGIVAGMLSMRSVGVLAYAFFDAVVHRNRLVEQRISER